jgi:hypothetical protein
MKEMQNKNLKDNQLWDTEIPNTNHENRFLEKLLKQNTKIKKKKKQRFAIPFAIAASFILSASITAFAIYNFQSSKNKPEVVLSQNTQQTTDYFASVVQSNLKELKAKQTPENKQMVDDAFSEIEKLEKDYQKLQNELYKHGENKQLLYALVTNLQTRITFLENVIHQIELINQSKSNSYENQI